MTKYLKNKIVLIGAGTLGSSLSIILFKKLKFESLAIIDPDKVNKENLNNQVYSTTDLGKYKVHSLKKILIELHKIPPKKITAIPSKFQEANQNVWKNADLIIDASDSLDPLKYLGTKQVSQQILFIKIRENNAFAYKGDANTLYKYFKTKKEHAFYSHIRTSWENSMLFSAWIAKNLNKLLSNKLYYLHINDGLEVYKFSIK